MTINTMKKNLTFLCLSTFLTGCATSELLDHPVEMQIEHKTHTDQITALGYATPPLKNHTTSLILQGKEANYSLDETQYGNFNALLLDTLNTIDPHALEIHQVGYQESTRIEGDAFYIEYKKLNTEVSENDRQFLIERKFRCDLKEENKQTYFYCLGMLPSSIQRIKNKTIEIKPETKTNLDVKLTIEDQKKHYGQYAAKAVPRALLYPFALTLDVITLPVVAPLYGGLTASCYASDKKYHKYEKYYIFTYIKERKSCNFLKF